MSFFCFGCIVLVVDLVCFIDVVHFGFCAQDHHEMFFFLGVVIVNVSLSVCYCWNCQAKILKLINRWNGWNDEK